MCVVRGLRRCCNDGVVVLRFTMSVVWVMCCVRNDDDDDDGATIVDDSR